MFNSHSIEVAKLEDDYDDAETVRENFSDYQSGGVQRQKVYEGPKFIVQLSQQN